MKHPDKKNEMPLRDYSWIIFLPFVALGWMAFKAALENAAALIVWLVYSLFLLFPILLILRYPVLTRGTNPAPAARPRALATALSRGRRSGTSCASIIRHLRTA